MIEVLYKDYSLIDGELHFIKEDYEAWNEEGNYTLLYKNLDNSPTAALVGQKPEIIVPTHLVCWIKPK